MKSFWKLVKEQKGVIGYYLFLICATGLVGYISLGRGFDFDVIPSSEGDGFSTLAFIKGIQERGFIGAWTNHRIGVPGGSTLIDFPGMGNLDILIYCILALFAKSTTAMLYIFLILSFIFDGVAMSLLMRKLKFNMEVSFVFSCLFAFAPYHFYRYLGHSSLILYISIPISLYLGGYIAGIIDEDKKWKLIVASVLLGIGYGYYYAFGLIILAIAYLIRFIRSEDKRGVLRKLWIGGLVLITVFAGMLPQKIYAFVKGPNLEAGRRAFFEQEIYGLKIINLLLPVTYSRIEPMRKLTGSYMSQAPLVNENHMASLGFVGAVGFIVLCFALIISFVNKKKCDNSEWKLIDYLSLITVSFVLIGAVGGFGEIFNWLVTPQIRCYNRSSIVLTGTSLIMVAVLVNKVRSKNIKLSIGLCILILCIGMFDQVKISPNNWQNGLRSTQEMYDRYFSAVEESLDDNAMVYQLPYMRYPENGPINNMPEYKPFVGYVFTDNLRWSYGAVRGRDARSRELYIDEGMSYDFLSGIKGAGFDAVYIDLDGYEDDGEQILEFYNGLGIDPIVAENGRLYLYDISGLEVAAPSIPMLPGSAFVKMWAKKYNKGISDDELVEVIEGLNQGDTAVYLILYNWFCTDKTVLDVSDNEYIDRLYNELMNREESDRERENWTAQMRDGMERQEVFCSFLNSAEFRNDKGLKTGK